MPRVTWIEGENHTLAKDLMTTPAISVTPDTSVRKAIELKLEMDVGCVMELAYQGADTAKQRA